MFNIIQRTVQFGDSVITLETGKIARQASGSVMAKMGDTVVLCTVVGNKKPNENIDFFPLTVNYLEKFYATGRIPGGFNKRESRPAERETLISRLIDRPIRPLFPEGFFNEVQIVCTTLSYDPNHQPDIVALIGASAALKISGIPFDGPIAAARVGYVDGEYTLNPKTADAEADVQLDLVVAGTKDAVLMVESEAKELSEEVMLGAVMFGHAAFQPIIVAINEMAEEVGNPTWDVVLPDNSEIAKKVKKIAEKKIAKAFEIPSKAKRYAAVAAAKDEVTKLLIEDEQLNSVAVNICFKNLESEIVRSKMLTTKKRIDGRGETDIRPIIAEVDVLPTSLVHGSALFTRGETQAIAAITLGTGMDEQLVDDIEGLRTERFMLHYNFPPYSVGEVGALRAPGRREIGHGKLAKRALNAMLPSKEVFPYTLRVVSEITESNGSSSMATVCGSSLALMAAGVPMQRPVAGIAMGLILEDKKFVILSDIMGDEDHLGDMDFKVAGTDNGITALQMDIKISGITEEIMKIALDQAKDGRVHILGEMAKALDCARDDVSTSAPRITTIKIKKEKIGELIGPGGKMIKSITEKTGAKIDISDEGLVSVASNNADSLNEALEMVKSIVMEPEIGQVFTGKITRVLDFGVVVAISKTLDGMVHVSEMAEGRVSKPEDVVNEGDEVTVRVIDIERNGRIKLSMKDLGNNIPVVEMSGDDEIDTEISSDSDSPRGSAPRGNRSRNDRFGGGGRSEGRSSYRSNDRGSSDRSNDRGGRNERSSGGYRGDRNERSDRSDRPNRGPRPERSADDRGGSNFNREDTGNRNDDRSSGYRGDRNDDRSGVGFRKDDRPQRERFSDSSKKKRFF